MSIHHAPFAPGPVVIFEVAGGRVGLSARDIHDMEESALNCRQYGFINFGTAALLIGGLALGGLLVYGAKSGQELPLWPAMAVALVNVIAAAKIVVDKKKARKQRQAAQTGTAEAGRPPVA